MEAVLLPNGICTVYGPVSARRADVGGVLRLSGLDDFLWEIQQGRPHIYSALGDGVYGQNGLKCVRTYFQQIGPFPLTVYQRICNSIIKPCRESIEWGFGEIQDIFQLCADRKNLRLGKKNPYFDQQMRVCHLLQNIYHCLNGDKTSGFRMFNCPPPVLEHYLRLVD